ncbi:hypothetical protein FKW77_006930 [Venturia effusa]|uniref:Uncharacterized protein n=1 Tax=Venturia effusa TaxID=50376 RepID=A0A517KWP5_9PEZI|nr:hypothetical protein FKW77_006930 [Venturia effusa]
MSASQSRGSSSRPISADAQNQQEEIKYGISTTIRSNSAADNAIQFNAPVAGTIIYWFVTIEQWPERAHEVVCLARHLNNTSSSSLVPPTSPEKIVTSLKLALCSHQSARETVFEGTTIKSVGKFVELSCSVQASIASSIHRFYVAENSPFDMILGPDFAS